jgi:hypothetical protein
MEAGELKNHPNIKILSFKWVKTPPKNYLLLEEF